MSEMERNEGLWELYGLKGNPFSTTPLLVKGGLLPIDCFYGRENELDRLKRIFSSEGGSRVLVSGDVGVGKTSFVNYARSISMNKGHFTHFKEIGVQEDWGAESFVMNTLYAVYSTLRLLDRGDMISKESYGRLQNLVEPTGMKTGPHGTNVAGFGVDTGRDAVVDRRTTFMSLMDFFGQIVQEIKGKTGKDIILHYNNLERLSEKGLRKLFEDLRDFFQTDGVHFVFVGNLTVQSIFQSMPRVSSIISDTPILLTEFSLKDIEEILRIRIECLRIPTLNLVTPFRSEVIRTLFELYGGNIRNVLNSLSTAVVEVTTEKPVTLNKNLLTHTLRSIVEKRYLANLPPRAKDILLEAVKHNETTNRSMSKNLKIARSNVSSYVRDLQNAGCLFLRRKDGKDKFWSVEPKIKWMLLQDETDKAQGDLTQFIAYESGAVV